MLLLDTSGEPLHKRGYRQDTGDAPLKETLAAAMIYLSNWRYKEPLFDPCTGSGTIAIEAAMIARNIAPGLRRHFAFEGWDWVNPEILKNARETAKSKIYPSGEYRIFASDISEEMIEKAKYNSKVAGVATDIEWGVFDITDGSLESKITIILDTGSGCLISNPPYGDRLDLDDDTIKSVHQAISSAFKKLPNLSGGIITNHAATIQETKKYLERRKLFNGSIECQYLYRKTKR